MSYLMQFIGYLLIWFAVYYNRGQKNKLVLFTKDWFVVLIMILIGANLILHSND